MLELQSSRRRSPSPRKEPCGWWQFQFEIVFKRSLEDLVLWENLKLCKSAIWRLWRTGESGDVGEAGWTMCSSCRKQTVQTIKTMQTMQMPKSVTPFCFFDTVLLLRTWQGRLRHSQPSRFGSDFTVRMATNTCQVFHVSSHRVKRCRHQDLGWVGYLVSESSVVVLCFVRNRIASSWPSWRRERVEERIKH